jgi:hypothetical protein
MRLRNGTRSNGRERVCRCVSRCVENQHYLRVCPNYKRRGRNDVKLGLCTTGVSTENPVGIEKFDASSGSDQPT